MFGFVSEEEFNALKDNHNELVRAHNKNVEVLKLLVKIVIRMREDFYDDRQTVSTKPLYYKDAPESNVIRLGQKDD